jgi:hypothetical protein
VLPVTNNSANITAAMMAFTKKPMSPICPICARNQSFSLCVSVSNIELANNASTFSAISAARVASASFKK